MKIRNRKQHRKARLFGTLALLLLAASESRANDVPVAPIAPAPYGVWTNTYRLHTAEATVIIAQETGQIVHLSHQDNTNLLHITKKGLGGHTLNPIAVPSDKSFQENTAPWDARAWRSSDGAQYGRLSREYGAPLNIRISRTIRLDPERAHITIRQHLERISNSEFAMTIERSHHLQQPDHIVLPIPVHDELPAPSHWHRCGDTAVYSTVENGSQTFEPNPEYTWIGVVSGRTILIEQDIIDESNDLHVRGSIVSTTSGQPNRHIVISQQAHARLSNPGDAIETTQIITLHPLPENLTSRCDIADFISDQAQQATAKEQRARQTQ